MIFTYRNETSNNFDICTCTTSPIPHLEITDIHREPCVGEK